MVSTQEVIQALQGVAEDFATEIVPRQKRRELDPADFEKVAEAGFLLTGVPVESGGLWSGVATSSRDYAQMVRLLAHGDPCVALVAAMHPAVTGFFLGVETVEDHPVAWRQQRAEVLELSRTRWWGTVTSEPGSGGDILKTRTEGVLQADGRYGLTGDKHFGSGSGHADFMVTTGKIQGNELPELFYLEYKDEPWDGSTGCKLTVPWDGMGMGATQSHAFRFDHYPATKAASSEVLMRVAPISTQLSNMLFTGVVLGITDNALAFARSKLAGKEATMRSFERVEWTRCQNELWLAEQAFEGALRAIEAEAPDAHLTATRCKVVCAELTEQALARMSKVVGGASYSKAMPLAQWVEDVKALGFLRPPLPLAYDQLMA